MQPILIASIEQEVKFSEVDVLGIVWHGHYIRYFEDGREAFGKKYGIGYLDFFNNGVVVPLVNVQCDFKRSLRYGDQFRVETRYINCDVAKLKFEYRLFNAGTGELVASGSSVQVFLDKADLLLQLTIPPFFEEWKKKQALI